MTSHLLLAGELPDASLVIFDSGVDDVVNKKASAVNLFIKFCVEQAHVHEDPFPTRSLVCKRVGQRVSDSDPNLPLPAKDVRLGVVN